MIGVGIAFVVLGVICLFVVPWVGVAAGIIGLLLGLLWLVGIGRGITRGGARREKSASPHL